MAGRRPAETHKLLRTESSVSVSAEIRESDGTEECTHTFRQFHGGNIPQQGRRDPFGSVMLSGLGPSAMVQNTSNDYFCSAHCGSRPYTGRPPEQEAGATSRMVLAPRGSRPYLREDIQTTCGSVCQSSKHEAADVLFVEERPAGLGSQRVGNQLGQPVGLCVPADLFGTGSIKESTNAQLPVNFSGTLLAETTLVSQTSRVISGRPDGTSTEERSANTREGSGGTSGPESVPTGGLADIRRQLRAQGLSKGAAKLISKSVRGSTHKVYRSRFREFSRWCDKRDLDPFKTPIVKVANFLAYKFKKGLSYSTLCGYRSAISAYHDNVDNRKLGEHPKLVKLLKGVFNCRQPQKRAAPNWSLTKVLSSLRRAPYEPLGDAGFKWVSLKTTFLFAITSACRCSDLARFGFENPYLRFVNSTEGVRLTPRVLKKQCRPGHQLTESFIGRYEKDRRLDPIRCLKIYLKRSKERRKHDGLFITFGKGKRVGQNASSQTISKWIVEVIKRANPGAENVTGHSTRAMSTSKALQEGVAVEAILKAADWSSDCTFAQHYLKDVSEKERAFTNAVLDCGQKK